MKVTVVKTGLLLCVLTIVSATQHASAAPSQDDILALGTAVGVEQKLAFASEITDQVAFVVAEDQAAEPKVPRTYVVAKGDSLAKIADKHQTTWQRVYDKNTSITHPDIINEGMTLFIPEANEKLQARELPLTSEDSAPVQSSSRKQSATSASTPEVSLGSSAGNRYVRGYCTWYAKNRRPDLPNNLGNANTWISRASAQGLSTGSTPRVGAIGQQGMHVVYVEQVHGDGTITVSEMNWNGWNVISSRRASASSFQYIY